MAVMPLARNILTTIERRHTVLLLLCLAVPLLLNQTIQRVAHCNPVCIYLATCHAMLKIYTATSEPLNMSHVCPVILSITGLRRDLPPAVIEKAMLRFLLFA